MKFLACPEASDQRAEQCSAFDRQPYQGRLYEWRPFSDDEAPCALTCQGRPQAEPRDDVVVVARLADRVPDGTRCRPGSLDMCIDGRCQRVGCDLRIGSNKQVDACGVCGGDGSSCSRPLYHWTLTFASLCSASCGGGYKMSRPICQNRVSGEEVAEELCNDAQKPDETVVECNIHACPPQWHAGEWGQCSATCDGGTKLRHVHCVEEINGTKIRVEDSRCGGEKPWSQETCNQLDCPTWIASKWSGCSVSCGTGIQTRRVECRDAHDHPSPFCPAETEPPSSKACSTGIQCPADEDDDRLMPGLYHTQPLVQPYPPPPSPERLVGERVVPSDATFIPDEWGQCSVTCGEGVRQREVYCKIFLEFSRTIAKLPDKQCSGRKPVEVEKCYKEPCSSERVGADDAKDDPFRSENIKVVPGSPAKSYSWKEQGYTHCSATCLGGVQELIVNCVRDDTQKVTSPYMCPIELKPEVIMRTCNDHPCPPRWSYSEFSPCSQSCGIGIQTREVNCIHEVTQGGSNTVIVPPNNCPQPPPPDRQYCNILDCPPRWKVGEWTKCSKSCGGGEKRRTVECQQVMAQNHTIDRPLSSCTSPKPLEVKPCNTKSCVIESDKPHIDVSNSTFIQHDTKKKKITVKVGGAATVYLGTTLKIKCPVKRFDRSKIQWAKDKNTLPKSKKYKISKKGALRVQNLGLRDSGVYTCIAGKSTANIQISVRPKPGEFPTSEEIQKHGMKMDLTPVSDNHGTRDGSPIFTDDHSHEQRPDGSKKKPTSRTRLFTPTLPSLRLDSNINRQNMGSTQNSEQDKSARIPSSSSDYLSPPETTSSATRVVPNFQMLISQIKRLWPFQTFKNSDGNLMVAHPEADEDLGATFTEDSFPLSTLHNRLEDDEEEDVDRIVVLGKGNKDHLLFEWVPGEWSNCNYCGSGSSQTRELQCIVRLGDTAHPTDDHLCIDAGVTSPPRMRPCANVDCARWAVGAWGPCGRCVGPGKGFQKRIVRCISGNMTINFTKCNQDERPIHKQECFNEKCSGKWKPGPWSKCTGECGQRGMKYRILQCVWQGSKKSAGTACRDLPRPPVAKPCTGLPCEHPVSLCRDESMFCSNVKRMNLCKVVRYREQCCQSCQDVDDF